MLGLFKEEEYLIEQDYNWNQARNLLISSLNKGNVPNWDSFFKELPILKESEELECIKNKFLALTQHQFLNEILEPNGTEYFFHSVATSQKLLTSGKKVNFVIPVDEQDWQLWLEIISIQFNQNWNVQNPFVSFYGEFFGNKYRLSLIHYSTSPLKKSKLILRSLAATPHPLESFGGSNTLNGLVTQKKNFIVAGSTGSGKTSLISTLLSEVDPNEHVVILEDTFEIISNHHYQTRLLAGDTHQTSLKSYLAYSMRLSPDRIILGEMRSHEVVPFLMAMNTGHKGLMGTIHASSAVDALNRVGLLFSIYGGEANLNFEKVMGLLCRNLEYVVFMENKKVKEIIKILGSDKGIPFFEYVEGEAINL
jgi:type IV secretion system protein VirB11